MKRIIYLTFLIATTLGLNSCKKFLNVNPPSDLSGNNYWQTKADVENFTNGLYQLFRQATFRMDMTAPPGNDEFPFFAWGGDMRGAPVRANSGSFLFRDYINFLAANNIPTVVNSLPNGFSDYFNAPRFTKWDRFYKVIAAANIAFDRIDGVPDPTLTAADKARYKSEAVFMRCITYFFLVRLYGDVPYYTNAYNTTPLKRMKMVEVLKNCAADMKQAKDGLPWTYDDPAKVAVRAMRGSALVLLMHINMWLASFDDTNATAYYKEVDSLGDELKDKNGGAYTLLPLSSTHQIFKGRSKEGLFEIPQNVNYGESFGYSAFSDNVLYAPYKNKAITGSYLSYVTDFMDKLYPPGVADKRITTWFKAGTYDKGDQTFLMLKFTNVYANQNAEDANPDDNQTVFRLPDAYLLQAEANANLGNDTKAQQLANLVRARAGAANLTTTGKDLADDIFYERCRELMGEGQYWYDVVRTKRIIDVTYKFGYHCTVEQFKAGAWTWPIDKSALINNPGITLNTYWQ
ncbi:MAG: RagB/SusD family nutrient uptake outer membrane protein [Bacteroidetes bacterium]|nr:RagB/SusD family nutrient uptake outer membrane protein [Bacteroidota bacterium]MBS1756674.1 RagB/SusD family nutrient uptake outer membrane protein [Bacteroidota bacterium]